MTEETYALKFTDSGGRARWGAGILPPVGESASVTDVKVCESGWHAATTKTLSRWLGHECYLVALSGERDDADDKYCAQTMRVVRRIPLSDQDMKDFVTAVSAGLPGLEPSAHAHANAHAYVHGLDDVYAYAYTYARVYAYAYADARVYAYAYTYVRDNANAYTYARDNAYAAMSMWLLARLRQNDPTGLPEIKEE